MKIIHTADWHIGQTFFGYDRFQEHQYFLDWLTDQITTQQIDVLLISGDIFDVANPSAQAQRQFYRFLRRVTEQNPGLQIILIAGNHDSASRLETPIPLLEEMNIQIRGTVRKRADGTIDTEELIIELKDRSGKRQGWCLAVPYLRQSRVKEILIRQGLRPCTTRWLPASKNAGKNKKPSLLWDTCKPQEVRFPKVIKVNA